MATTPENISKTLIIPTGSQERFVRFPEGNESAGWTQAGILISGISRLTGGYRVYRRECQHHFLGLPTKGRLEVLLDSRMVPVPAGDVIFLRAGTLHHYESRRALSMVWFHLNPAHPHWGRVSHRKNFARPCTAIDQTLPLMERAIQETQSPTGAIDGLPELLFRLILAYLDRELGHDPSDALLLMRERLDRVWAAVNRDLTRPWNVESLAKLAGLSVSQFHANVLAVYQLPPMQIVRTFRVEYAQTLLRNTDHTLEAIAERTGYSSAFSLSRAFKETVRVSPRTYRSGGSPR